MTIVFNFERNGQFDICSFSWLREKKLIKIELELIMPVPVGFQIIRFPIWKYIIRGKQQ